MNTDLLEEILVKIPHNARNISISTYTWKFDYDICSSTLEEIPW